MNIAVAIDDVRHDALPSASEAGPAPKRIVVAYGFWIFLLSDIVMFAAIFAAYSVLVRATAGGPSGAQLFNQGTAAIETACLLVSSYTCGWMSLAAADRRRADFYLGAVVTFVLGADPGTVDRTGLLASHRFSGATQAQGAPRCAGISLIANATKPKH